MTSPRHRKKLHIFIILVCFHLGLVACQESPHSRSRSISSSSGDEALGSGGGGKEDAWGYANDPKRFGLPLTYDVSALPMQGRVKQSPWPETYWPSRDDSYNTRWLGEQLSPLEKYDLAFNGWVPPYGFERLRPLTMDNCERGAWDPEYYEALGPAARAWSELRGNYMARNGVDDDGDGLIDECDDMDGIEQWWGTCHAWVPASILEAEPLEAVELNGVRFEVSDIKALLMLMYDSSQQLAVGDRCLEEDPKRDLSGRIINTDCRNINAGSFHLLLTNLVGVMGRSLGEDRMNGAQVWNHPILAYQVIERRELSKEQASTRLGQHAGGSYVFNEVSARFMYFKTRVEYLTESEPSAEPWRWELSEWTRSDTYEYVLELDAQGAVLGGEWIAQRDEHGEWMHTDRPDYLWLPLGAGLMPIQQAKAEHIERLHRLSRPETREQALVIYRSSPNERIPDWPKAGLSDTIEVREPLFPSKVTVKFAVAHDFLYDLSVRLVRDGQEFVLFNRSPQASMTGFTGEVELPALAGLDASGSWELIATDHNARSYGRLFDWSLEFEQ